MEIFDYERDVYDLKAINGQLLIISDKDLSETSTSIIKKIFTNTDDDYSSVIFKRCIFNNFTLDNCSIECSCEFSGCQFYGNTKITNAQIQKTFEINDTIFHGNTRIEGCCFKKNIYLERITTRTSSPFYFKDNHAPEEEHPPMALVCSQCVFNDEAVFSYITNFSFWFSDILFNDEFYFTNSKFDIKSYFTNMNFPQSKKGLYNICFQTLYKALLKADMPNDAEDIKKYMRQYGSGILAQQEETPSKEHVVYSNREAADYIGVRPSTLDTWRALGPEKKHQPRPLNGRPIRYTKEALDTYLQECETGSK